MAFLDMDVTEQVAGKHELWEINNTVTISSLAYRWFCGFTAFEKTPDRSCFGRFRERLGTKRIGKLFNAIVKKQKKSI